MSKLDELQKICDDPAFPQIKSSAVAPHTDTGVRTVMGTYSVGGLSKRELFAAMAMQGLLSAVYSSKEMLSEFTEEKYSNIKTSSRYLSGCDAISHNAVSYADALIKALEESK